MDNKVIVQLIDHNNNLEMDLEIDLDITAYELFWGLNSSLGWGYDIHNNRDCYLTSENPIVLLRGNTTLRDYGIRNGSIIHFVRYMGD